MNNVAKSNRMLPLIQWLRYHFIEKKFGTPLGFLIMIFAGLAIAYLTSKINYIYTSAVAGSVVGIFLFLVCLKYPLFGIYFTILFSSAFALPGRIYGIVSPVGVIVEILTYVLALAVLGNYYLRKENMSAFWGNPISIMLFIIMIYYIVESGNPDTKGREGWFYFVRKQISYLLFFYIAYLLLNSYKKIKVFITFFIFLALAISLYGIKQQWFGLANFEQLWISQDRLLMELYFQGGFLRKFSFLTDPPAFGVLCAAFGLFTLVLGFRLNKKKGRYALYLITGLLFLASSYSGSRTCNLMITAGITAYAVFTLNERRTYKLLAACACIGAFILVGPFENNVVVYRVKSSFQPARDASLTLRDRNRHSIQPYIYSHPIGGGLNTSSIEGRIYNPGHYLAGFPPDSGYMKILLEQGWIGFALHLVLYFTILKRGIDCFFRARNPSIKTIYIALTIFMFSLIVGQYSQVAISQYPLILFYYAALAILIKLIDYDKPNAHTNES